MLFFFSLHPCNFARPVEHLVVLRQGHLRRILPGLILSPGFFTHLFLQSKTLIVGLHFLQCLLALLLVFVFEQSSHARYRFSLLCISLLVGKFLSFSKLFLSHLLVSPVSLVLSVDFHAFPIHLKQSNWRLDRYGRTSARD